MASNDWEDWSGNSSDEDYEDSMTCLFCNLEFPNATALFDHCNTEHQFNWHEAVGSLDLVPQIQLINYIRTQILHKKEEPSHVVSHLNNTVLKNPAMYQTPDFFAPVLAEDALLYSLEDDFSDDEEPCAEPSTLKEEEDENVENASSVQEQLSKCTELIQQLTADAQEVPQKLPLDCDKYYFDSYSATGIHREMISDKVRTDSYMHAIEKNAHLFKDKVVLDVGCGSGILSLFAARAGASKVYAVDSSQLVDTTREIIKANNFEKQITVIQGKVEDIVLPVEQVDIIVSEWMGYCLLYESMLDSVLVARDRWLKPTGYMFPDVAEMFLQGITDLDNRTEYWNNVYGFNMSPMKQKVALQEPFVQVTDPSAVLTDRVKLASFNTSNVRYADLDYKTQFSLCVKSNGIMHGLLSSFDIGFIRDCTSPVEFSTGAESTPTHWQQVFFYFSTPLNVSAGSCVSGNWSLKRNSRNHRFIDVEISWAYNGESVGTQKYCIE